MSDRLLALARETEEIVAAGGYRDSAVRIDTAAVRLYGPDPVAIPPAPGRATRVEVTGESSLDAARRVGGRVAVLNFASAHRPGGGYLDGVQSQEEALCRGSALYQTLLHAPSFYDYHRANRDPFYSDRVIHSPDVPIIRDGDESLLDKPFLAGFLTCPAPNALIIRQTAPEQAPRIPSVLAQRAARILEVAAANDYPALVLGAWGCGVFRNDPATVATAFRDLLAGRFAGYFDTVVFAVLASPTAAVRVAFDKVFPPTPEP